MILSKDKKPALLIVDVQKGFEDIDYWGGERNNLNAESNIEILLGIWRKNGLPIFHIKHCSTNPQSPLSKNNPGNQFMKFNTPLHEETVIEKEVNSAFIGTDLEEQLQNNNINSIVVVGLTTDHCVSTTTRMAGNLGFDTYLVEDAVATFNKTGVNDQKYSAQLIHDTAIASLKDEFATIVSTETLVNMIN